MKVFYQSFTGRMNVIDKVSGWEVVGGSDLYWIGTTGPMLTLIGGILMIVCAAAALILLKVNSEAETIFEPLNTAVRAFGVLAIIGAAYYVIDASNSGCDALPDGIGWGPWIAIAAGLGGLSFGVTKPAWTPAAPELRKYSYRESRLAGPASTLGSAKDHFYSSW